MIVAERDKARKFIGQWKKCQSAECGKKEKCVDSAVILIQLFYWGNSHLNLIFGSNLMFIDQFERKLWSNCAQTSCLHQNFDEKTSHLT